MSGPKVPIKTKKPKEIAEFVGLLHGAKSTDPKFYQGLQAMARNITSSHVGALLRFSDDKLFEKYVKNSGLSYSITEENGQNIYAVEINFGPLGLVGIGDTQSYGILYSQIEACLSTNFLSPVILTEKGRAILRDKNTVKWRIFPHEEVFDIGITTSIHESLVPQRFKDKNDLKTIHNALIKFADDLENAESAHLKTPDYTVLMRSVNMAFEDLRQTLDPDMPMAQFKGEIDKFVSIGTPPEESIPIPLTTDPSDKNGIPLELMLQFLVDPNNAAPYNLVLNNCAHYIRKMFMYATKDNPDLQKVFESGVLSEENILGWVASLVSPHLGANIFDPPDVSTPVIIGRMLLVLQQEMHKLNAGDHKLNAGDHKYKTLSDENLPLRAINNENLDPNQMEKRRPRYVLGIYPTIKKENSLHHHPKSEVDAVGVANKICAQLNERLGKQAFEVVPDGKKTVVLDERQQALIAIEMDKDRDQIRITCYDDTTQIDDFLAKAIREQLKINNNEKLNFNITGQNPPEDKELINAILREYDSKQVNIRLHM